MEEIQKLFDETAGKKLSGEEWIILYKKVNEEIAKKITKLHVNKAQTVIFAAALSCIAEALEKSLELDDLVMCKTLKMMTHSYIMREESK